MRTYEVIDAASGAVLRTETVDDPIRPSLLAGQELRLLELDGEKLAEESRVVIGPGEVKAEPQPLPEPLVTEAEALKPEPEVAEPAPAAEPVKDDNPAT